MMRPFVVPVKIRLHTCIDASKVRTLRDPCDPDSRSNKPSTMTLRYHIANRPMPSPRKRDAGLRAWFAHEGVTLT